MSDEAMKAEDIEALLRWRLALGPGAEQVSPRDTVNERLEPTLRAQRREAPGRPSLQPMCEASRSRHVSFLQESAFAQLSEGLLKLLLGIHHDRAVPGYRLFEWLARNQEEANAIFSGLHRNFVAPIEQNEGTVVGLDGRRSVEPLK